MRMRTGAAVIMTTVLSGAAFAADQGPPAWAYPVAPPPPVQTSPAAPPVVDPELKRVPGSTIALTQAQVRDLYNVPDWHPDDHPMPPDIVLRGRKPGVFACGYCHLASGLGRPENASLAGLPAAYIMQQVLDFKSGARKSAQPSMTPPPMMVTVAKFVSDDDLKAAADYFASLKSTPWIRVVEAKLVPQTHVAGAMYMPVKGGAMEPIGNRIVEVPEDVPRTELRDSRSGFIAYVPPGSIKRGELLVTTGGKGKTIACTVCHGLDLRGLGPVPALAGRSPSYIARQIYDIQHGVRAGLWSALMKPVVAKLDETDLVAIAAYTASLTP